MKKPGLLILCATVAGLTVLAQTSAPGHQKGRRSGNSVIHSEHCDFDLVKRVFVYTGHVFIDDPDMKLQCAKITATMPAGSGHPNRIVAENSVVQTNVVIDLLDDHGGTNHVTGHLAVYEFAVAGGVTNETVTVTGDPHIAATEFTGTADELKWDRATGHMAAKNPNFISTSRLDSVLAPTNAAASK